MTRMSKTVIEISFKTVYNVKPLAKLIDDVSTQMNAHVPSDLFSLILKIYKLNFIIKILKEVRLLLLFVI